MFTKTFSQRIGYFLGIVFATAFILITFFSSISPAQSSNNLDIAAALSLSGEGISFGQPTLEGIQFAVEEANADNKPRINLTIYDDQSSDDVAKTVAAKVVASSAALVIGPSFSTASLAAGSLYASAGMASLPPTATSDAITSTASATTFRVIFKNSDQGEILAHYLARALGQSRAAVFVVDTSYGRTIQEGFQRAAEQLKIDAQYYLFKTVEEAEQIAQRLGTEGAAPPIVFCTLDPEAARILTKLRRLGITGPFLGPDAISTEGFPKLFSDLPEEKTKPGYFTSNVYGLSPTILDSGNQDILSFTTRFRKRFDHDPTWQTVAGFDAANLSIGALRKVAAENTTNKNLQEQRTKVFNYLLSIDSLDKSVPGLLGSLWFDSFRGRQMSIRIGKFNANSFESAPLQIEPVSTPDPSEISAGTVFKMGERYGRLQQVVYTGVFINEISRIDLPQSSFSADFYLWLRFAGANGLGNTDPTDLIFPNLLKGNFDPKKPAEKRKAADGTEYWLWRVQGDFRNDFDLRLFPFDRQSLSLSFFNARSALDRIVYVVDNRSAVGVPDGGTQTIASSTAFRNLTQWDPISSNVRRENLVTNSSLGDITRIGLNIPRELSGFLVNVELRRRTLVTLSKSLLPLLLMAMIMFASTYFPAPMLAPRAISLVLSVVSGTVLLTSINNQFASVGYTIAVEYLFYVYFSLALFLIVSLFITERLRPKDNSKLVLSIEFWTRVVFLMVIAGTFVWMTVLYWRS